MESKDPFKPQETSYSREQGIGQEKTNAAVRSRRRGRQSSRVRRTGTAQSGPAAVRPRNLGCAPPARCKSASRPAQSLRTCGATEAQERSRVVRPCNSRAIPMIVAGTNKDDVPDSASTLPIGHSAQCALAVRPGPRGSGSRRWSDGCGPSG